MPSLIDSEAERATGVYFTLVATIVQGAAQALPTKSTDHRYDHSVAARSPLRILLAEDNVVNQKVATRTLERLGYRADLAGNGLEVLDALQRQPYDVVLMDVQMPELDGLETTRRIRRELAPARQPRIIAFSEVRCRLRRRTKDERPRARTVRPSSSVIGPSSKPARDFQIAQLGSPDADRVRRAAHSLKGSGLAVGARDLAAACDTIERLLCGGDYAAAAEMVPQVEARLGEAVAALQAGREGLLASS